MTDLTRRDVNKAAAWAMPVVLAAVAAPAVNASTVPPPPVCVDPEGLKIVPAPGTDFKENNGQGFTLVKGDSIFIDNVGPYDHITVTITAWTSAHQDGIQLVGASGDTLLPLTKDGNRASVDLIVEKNSPRLLQVIAPEKNAEAHLIIGCNKGFILKSAR